MPNQFYVPGPVRASIGQTAGSSLSFLGWASEGVNVAIQPRFDDVPSDIAGPAIPHDVQFFGADAMIRLTLSRYDEAVFATLSSLTSGGVEGSWSTCAIGTLLKHEAKAFRLFLRAPCQTKTGQTGQRGVWNFPIVFPTEIDYVLSSRTKRPRITLRAIADIRSADGSAVLFDTVATGEPTYSF